MKLKFLLPRKLYYFDWSVGNGWVGLIYEDYHWHLICAGYDFKQTLRHLEAYDYNE